MGVVSSPGYALIFSQPGTRALKVDTGPHDALESLTAPLPVEGVTTPGARVGTLFFIAEEEVCHGRVHMGVSADPGNNLMWGRVESPYLDEEIGLLLASSVALWVTLSTSRRAGNGHRGMAWPSSGSLAWLSAPVFQPKPQGPQRRGF